MIKNMLVIQSIFIAATLGFVSVPVHAKEPSFSCESGRLLGSDKNLIYDFLDESACRQALAQAHEGRTCAGSDLYDSFGRRLNHFDNSSDCPVSLLDTAGAFRCDLGKLKNSAGHLIYDFLDQNKDYYS